MHWIMGITSGSLLKPDIKGTRNLHYPTLSACDPYSTRTQLICDIPIAVMFLPARSVCLYPISSSNTLEAL